LVWGSGYGGSWVLVGENRVYQYRKFLRAGWWIDLYLGGEVLAQPMLGGYLAWLTVG
jgi:hypothetical protein